jgi:DNA-binding transcriptional MerR regulator
MSEQLYTINEVEQLGRVSRRTIHFYVKEGLLPPPQGRGRSARYSEGHILRLILIGLLKSSTHLRLEGISEIIEPLSLKDMRHEIAAMGGPSWPPGGPVTAPGQTATPGQSAAPEIADRPSMMDPSPARIDDPDALLLDLERSLGDEEQGGEERRDQESSVDEDAPRGAIRNLASSSPESSPIDEVESPPDEAERPPLESSPRPESSPAHFATPTSRRRAAEWIHRMSASRGTTGADAEELADTWHRVRVSDDIEIHFRGGTDDHFKKKVHKLIARARRIFRK